MTVWQRGNMLQGNNGREELCYREIMTVWQRGTLLQGNNDSMAESNSVTGK